MLSVAEWRRGEWRLTNAPFAAALQAVVDRLHQWDQRRQQKVARRTAELVEAETVGLRERSLAGMRRHEAGPPSLESGSRSAAQQRAHAQRMLDAEVRREAAALQRQPVADLRSTREH